MNTLAMRSSLSFENVVWNGMEQMMSHVAQFFSGVQHLRCSHGALRAFQYLGLVYTTEQDYSRQVMNYIVFSLDVQV